MAAAIFSNKRTFFFYSLCWAIWIITQAWVIYWFGFTWQVAFIDSVVSNLLLAIAQYALTNVLNYYRPRKDKGIYIFVLNLGIAAIWISAVKYILAHIMVQDTHYLEFLHHSLPIRFGIAFLMTGWMMMFSWVHYSAEDKQAIEKRKEDAEKLSREAELYKLRHQFHPHFLFNSLNSISSLVTTNPEDARKMVHQLADFLRGSLRNENKQQVSFKEELEYLQLYLDIEKVRFGHRLSIKIEKDTDCIDCLMPPLLLQPIVENAIKFGLYDVTEMVIIHIKARLDNGQLVINIQNPFDPVTTTTQHGAGFGLSSIERRLYLLFARHDLLETIVNGNIFTTIIKIPQ